MFKKYSSILNLGIQKPELVFAFLSIFLGGLFVVTIPPLWGLDETSHFARAYQIANGDFIPERDPGESYGGTMPKNFNDLAYYALADIAEPKDANIFTRKDVNNIDGYSKYLKQSFSTSQEKALNPASYSIFAYPLSVVAIFIAKILNLNIGDTLIMARVGSLIAYTVIVASAIFILRKYKLKWLVFYIGLLPVMLFQAAVLSADTIVNALSLLFFAVLFRIIIENKPWDESKKFIGILGLVALLMPLAKLNYVFISLMFVLIPSKSFRTNVWSLITKFLIALSSIGLTILWGALTKVTNTSGYQPREGMIISGSDQLSFLIDNPLSFVPTVLRTVLYYGDSYMREFSSVLGWNYVQLPIFILFILFIIFLTISTYIKNELIPIKNHLSIMTMLSLLGVLSIFGSLYVGFTPTGSLIIDGVQGRYFLPFALPVICLLSIAIPFSFTKKHETRALYVCLLASILVIIFSYLYYLKATY